jgi:protein involved in polysaccharide export with SLBB domain
MKKIFVLAIMLFSFSIFAQESEQQSSRQTSISTLQPISVTIGGDFILTGSFPASRLQRVDQFISVVYNQGFQQLRGGLNQLNVIDRVTKELRSYPLRNIVLKRFNGDAIKIDLQKFRLTGDFKYNPYLMNDDVIIFPSWDNDKDVIDINGAVNKPTKFQFVEGDKLSDAILFAGGINQSYSNVETAEISRLSSNGNQEQVINVKIKEDYLLQSGDRIRILADENHKLNYKVLVLGEVKYPGYIYVTKDSTSLHKLIMKAGGITSNADLDRAELIRDENAENILKQHYLAGGYESAAAVPEQAFSLKERMKFVSDSLSVIRSTTLNTENIIDYFGVDNTLRVLKNDQVVDFAKVMTENTDESKFIVQDGDIVLIPRRFDYVYVFGQVSKVGYVKHSAGKDVNYYVEKAGGFAPTANVDQDDISIIKGKGKTWFTENKDKTTIEPGDFVFVPKNTPRSFWYYFSKTSSVIGTIGSLATIILLLIKL